MSYNDSLSSCLPLDIEQCFCPFLQLLTSACISKLSSPPEEILPFLSPILSCRFRFASINVFDQLEDATQSLNLISHHAPSTDQRWVNMLTWDNDTRESLFRILCQIGPIINSTNVELDKFLLKVTYTRPDSESPLARVTLAKPYSLSFIFHCSHQHQLPYPWKLLNIITDTSLTAMSTPSPGSSTPLNHWFTTIPSSTNPPQSSQDSSILPSQTSSPSDHYWSRYPDSSRDPSPPPLSLVSPALRHAFLAVLDRICRDADSQNISRETVAVIVREMLDNYFLNPTPL